MPLCYLDVCWAGGTQNGSRMCFSFARWLHFFFKLCAALHIHIYILYIWVYSIYICMIIYVYVMYIYLLYSQSWNTLRNPRALLLEAVLYVDAPIPFPHPRELKNLRSTYCAIIQDSGDMSTCCWTQVCLIITISICWYRLIWWILPSKLPKLVDQYVSTVINLLVGSHR